MNKTISPMLANASPPFDSSDWLFEIKWDGERMIAFVEKEMIVRLQNRHGHDATTLYPEIIGLPVKANEAILDGEVVVFGEDNRPSFSKLSERSHLENSLKIALLSKAMPAVFIPFDLIRYNGTMIDRMPLIKRKDILRSILPEGGSIISPFFVENQGEVFFDTVVKMGYEGIMAKKKDSYYLFDKRSDLWLKMKPRKLAICRVMGFTTGQGYRSRLGALVIAQQKEKGVWVERGRVGSGIKDKTLGEILDAVRPLTERNGVTWVEPTLEIEVAYFEETETGHFRCPVFKRIVQTSAK